MVIGVASCDQSISHYTIHILYTVYSVYYIILWYWADCYCQVIIMCPYNNYSSNLILRMLHAKHLACNGAFLRFFLCKHTTVKHCFSQKSKSLESSIYLVWLILIFDCDASAELCYDIWERDKKNFFRHRQCRKPVAMATVVITREDVSSFTSPCTCIGPK